MEQNNSPFWTARAESGAAITCVNRKDHPDTSGGREGEREAVSFPLTSAPHERDSLMSVDTVVTWWPPLALLHEHAIQHTTLGPDITFYVRSHTLSRGPDELDAPSACPMSSSLVMLKCYTYSTYNQQNLPFQSVRRVSGTWGRDEDTRSVAAACATRPAPPPPVEFMFMRTAREADASAGVGGGMVPLSSSPS